MRSSTTEIPLGRDVLANAAATLAELLDAYHTVSPEDLGALVADAAERCGASDCTLYLQDYDQEMLVPLPSNSAENMPLPIDSSVAGRAFADEQEIEEPDGTASRLWLPLLDGTDRLGVLGARVNRSDEAARWCCRRLAALAALFLISKGENSDHYFWTRRRRPMSLPAEMQWHLLPALTTRTPRVSIAGVLEPAYSVGGDAFDYAINGDIAHVAIVDSMGHDIDASEMAAVTVGSYRHSRRQQLGLADTHAAMDSLLVSQFSDDQFATAQLAELHLGSGELHLLNAGHPAPLLVGRSGQTRALPTVPALPVGIGAGEAPVVTSVTLEPGDRVLFFTDGVVENRLPDGEPLGEERLREAFARECADGRTASETVRRLSRSSPGLHGGHTRDDATWVLVEWQGNEDSLA